VVGGGGRVAARVWIPPESPERSDAEGSLEDNRRLAG
jgi:hypothetical protein